MRLRPVGAATSGVTEHGAGESKMSTGRVSHSKPHTPKAALAALMDVLAAALTQIFEHHLIYLHVVLNNIELCASCLVEHELAAANFASQKHHERHVDERVQRSRLPQVDVAATLSGTVQTRAARQVSVTAHREQLATDASARALESSPSLRPLCSDCPSATVTRTQQ